MLIFGSPGNVDDPLPDDPDTTVGQELLRPTEIYVKPVVELLNEDFEIHGLAHITGGGFLNLNRLKKGIGYDIGDLPEPYPLFMSIYKSDVPLEEMYRVFNMNIGFVVIVSPEDADKAIKSINNHKKAYKIGYAREDIIENIKIKAFDGSIINFKGV